MILSAIAGGRYFKACYHVYVHEIAFQIRVHSNVLPSFCVQICSNPCMMESAIWLLNCLHQMRMDMWSGSLMRSLCNNGFECFLVDLHLLIIHFKWSLLCQERGEHSSIRLHQLTCLKISQQLWETGCILLSNPPILDSGIFCSAFHCPRQSFTWKINKKSGFASALLTQSKIFQAEHNDLAMPSFNTDTWAKTHLFALDSFYGNSESPSAYSCLESSS